jgi:hypothetical protein
LLCAVFGSGEFTSNPPLRKCCTLGCLLYAVSWSALGGLWLLLLSRSGVSRPWLLIRCATSVGFGQVSTQSTHPLLLWWMGGC